MTWLVAILLGLVWLVFCFWIGGLLYRPHSSLVRRRGGFERQTACAQNTKLLPRWCSVCAGKPLPSGRQCICGGGGTEQHEIDGLRLGYWRLSAEHEALRFEHEAALRSRQALLATLTPVGAALTIEAREWLASVDAAEKVLRGRG